MSSPAADLARLVGLTALEREEARQALADFVFYVRSELDPDAREGTETGPEEIDRVLARCDQLAKEFDL